jgi:hypothetical protein
MFSGDPSVPPPVTAAGFESPSLATRDEEGPAFELKFLLDENRAREVESWARERLVPDPHRDPTLDGAYRTTSLYCDTPELDVYHRRPKYRRSKFRVRRYGAMPWVFLERKSKRGDRVAKQRVTVAEGELDSLAHPMSLVDWPGHWFHLRLLARRLGPACRITYERTAFAGTCPGGPLRLTLDRRLRGVLAQDWVAAPFEGGLPLLTGRVILEFKFRAALPALFRQLVADFRLAPAGVSKYRLCREAWGLSGLRREVADA